MYPGPGLVLVPVRDRWTCTGTGTGTGGIGTGAGTYSPLTNPKKVAGSISAWMVHVSKAARGHQD